jgi:hypothetical protein
MHSRRIRPIDECLTMRTGLNGESGIQFKYVIDFGASNHMMMGHKEAVLEKKMERPGYVEMANPSI